MFTLRGCPTDVPKDVKTRPRLSLPYEPETQTRSRARVKKPRDRDVAETGDSLYYCGIQARISQFVLSQANKNRAEMSKVIR